METMWYYTQGDSDRLGPVSESELLAKLASGELRKRDLVWKEGMPEWAPVRARPEFRAAPANSAAKATVPAVPHTLPGWMAFVGVLTILLGVLSILTCIGIIPGILLIIAGAGLLQARSALAAAEHVDPALYAFFAGLNRFMVMIGIMFIVSFVFGVLLFIAGLVGAAGH